MKNSEMSNGFECLSDSSVLSTLMAEKSSYVPDVQDKMECSEEEKPMASLVRKILNKMDPLSFIQIQSTCSAMADFFTYQMGSQKFNVPTGEMFLSVEGTQCEEEATVLFSFVYCRAPSDWVQVHHTFKASEVFEKLMAFRYFRIKRLVIQSMALDRTSFDNIWRFIVESDINVRDLICLHPSHLYFIRNSVELVEAENLWISLSPGIGPEIALDKDMTRSIFFDNMNRHQLESLIPDSFRSCSDLTICTPFELGRCCTEIVIHSILQHMAPIFSPINRMFAWHPHSIRLQWIRDVFNMEYVEMKKYFEKIDHCQINDSYYIWAEKENGVVVNVFCKLNALETDTVECEKVIITQGRWDMNNCYRQHSTRIWDEWNL